ncbi:MAG TPA: M28 family metallopeptidase [Candidatus Eremiobacteraceae bacterium]|nr:M28 family metallopeptidase [Candidatus Eremiobacteraceae bacterium]
MHRTASRPTLAAFTALIAAVLCGCAHLTSAVPTVSEPIQSRTTDAGCDTHRNDTTTKLDACIQQSSLWQHLREFQRIADANPDAQGHGNRDTGTPGYEASVDHVARLMRGAGYHVTIEPYTYRASQVMGTPVFGTPSGAYAYARDWFVARRSGSGSLTAPVQAPRGSLDGCSPADFAGFTRGHIALLARGACSVDAQVTNAQHAGAGAAILYVTEGGPFETRIDDPAGIPVVGFASSVVGEALLQRYRSGNAPLVHIDVRMGESSGVDYNVIADSPYGDSHHVFVVDAHLDSIYGAGMLDNASGSTSILETALALANTPTKNRLRYIWFGGEEIGLLGSRYYTRNLTPSELRRIVFDFDVDVTATPNYDIQIADPAKAGNVDRFPPNVVPESRAGKDAIKDYFSSIGIVARTVFFGNDGTDSNSFSLVGVPNTGILTMQDCCKRPVEVRTWGGFLGDYEGQIPGFTGGCVDMPFKWCDNLSNNDPFVLGLVSKAVAQVTLQLANDSSLGR